MIAAEILPILKRWQDAVKDADDVLGVLNDAQYGGGGHRNAAGFRVTFEQARELELA